MSHWSHSSHGNHGSHSSHASHASTSPKPSAGARTQTWNSDLTAPATNAAVKTELQSIRTNIDDIKANKSPWAIITAGVAAVYNPSLDFSGASDTALGAGGKIAASQFNTLRNNLNTLNKWMRGTAGTVSDGAGATNSVPNGNGADISDATATAATTSLSLAAITALKNSVKSLAAVNLSASHASHWNSTSGVGHGSHASHSSSDERLKKNIEDLKYGLETVMALHSVEYDWKSNDNHDIGFIAQQVQPLVPEIVATKDDGTLAVDYSKVVAILVRAVQEQQAQIEELKRYLRN